MPIWLCVLGMVLSVNAQGFASGQAYSMSDSPLDAWAAKKDGFRKVLIGAERSGNGDWQQFQLITMRSYIGAKQIAEEHEWTSGQANAYRHAIWQSQLCAEFGAKLAKALGDFQEEGSENKQDSAADQYNNEVARQITVHYIKIEKPMSGCLAHILKLIKAQDQVFILDSISDLRVQKILDHGLLVEDTEVVFVD